MKLVVDQESQRFWAPICWRRCAGSHAGLSIAINAGATKADFDRTVASTRVPRRSS